ncbi:MAG: acetyl-CoA carboxylase biotin carboxyl carrier protein [Pseudomonadota bacterium]|nr:acetyl-CoA carboxylase biotin carboxyl carrier protein [Pseudomonadota bacterium]
MDIRKVKKLIELLEESGMAEIEITEGEEAVRISRYPTSNSSNTYPIENSESVSTTPIAISSETKSSLENESSKEETNKSVSGHQIKAPMVGTFYSASSPEAKSYVNVGDIVNIGQTLCIIEAMKMMNQIESDIAGKILSIEVNNGEPVEYEQTLFVIQPA